MKLSRNGLKGVRNFRSTMPLESARRMSITTLGRATIAWLVVTQIAWAPLAKADVGATRVSGKPVVTGASAANTLKASNDPNPVNIVKELGGLKKIQANPKLLEKYLGGMTVKELQSALKDPQKAFSMKQVGRVSLKDRFALDSRMKSTLEAEKSAPKRSSGSRAKGSKFGADSAETIGKATEVAKGGLKMSAPTAAVVLSSSGAADISEIVVPRSIGLFFEDMISTNDFEENLSPIFPDEESDSEQYMKYTRSSSSAPAPGTFKIYQGKTDLVYDKYQADGWASGFWFSYNINMEEFDVTLPVNSSTFLLEFNDSDEVKSAVDLSSSGGVSVKFGGKLTISEWAQATIIVGGALLTAVLALIPIAGAALSTFVAALVISIEVLANTWVYATFAVKGTQINNLVLQIDKTSDSAIYIKDVKDLDLDVGTLTVVGSDFTDLLDIVAKLFNNRIADALGVDGTELDGCTSLSNCGSKIAELWIMRGSLSASDEEDCWKEDESGNLQMKSKIKSMKCQIVQGINSALEDATELDLEQDRISLSPAKDSLKVDNNDFITKWDLNMSSSASKGSCVSGLSDYSGGLSAKSYSIEPKGDLDIYLPISKVEELVHLWVLKGEFCEVIPEAITDPTTGAVLKVNLAPSGQFDIDTSTTIASGLAVKGVTRSTASVTKGGGSGTASASKDEFTFWMRAPVKASLSGSLNVGGSNVTVSGDLQATGAVQVEVEMSCSETNGMVLKFKQGTVTDMSGSYTTPVGSQTCNDATCPIYATLQGNLNTEWNTFVQGLNDTPIELPTIAKFSDLGVYISLDTAKTGFVDDLALHLPVQLTTTDPCDSGSSGGGGGIDGGGGYNPRDIPVDFDRTPGDDDDEELPNDDLGSAAEMQTR